MLLELRTKHVGEQVALHIADNCVALIRQSGLQTIALRITHKVGFDPEHRSDIEVKLAATTEDVKASDGCQVGMHIYEGKSYRHFYLRIILRDQGHRC